LAADTSSGSVLREGMHASMGVLGALAPVFYRVIATMQPAYFWRIYSAYGGVSYCCILWEWLVELIQVGPI